MLVLHINLFCHNCEAFFYRSNKYCKLPQEIEYYSSVDVIHNIRNTIYIESRCIKVVFGLKFEKIEFFEN